MSVLAKQRASLPFIILVLSVFSSFPLSAPSLPATTPLHTFLTSQPPLLSTAALVPIEIRTYPNLRSIHDAVSSQCSLQSSSAFTALPHLSQKLILACACLLHATGGSFVNPSVALFIDPSSIPFSTNYAVTSRTITGRVINPAYMSVEAPGSPALSELLEFASTLSPDLAESDPDVLSRYLFTSASRHGWDFTDEEVRALCTNTGKCACSFASKADPIL